MDEAMSFDAMHAAMRRVNTLMTPVASDTNVARVAKCAFGVSLIVGGTAVLTVIASSTPPSLETA